MKLGPLILLRLLLAIGSSDGAPSGKHVLPPSGGVWVKTVVASDSGTVQFGARMAAITLQEEEADSPASQWTLVNVDGAWRLRAKFPNGRTIKYISASAESEFLTGNKYFLSLRFSSQRPRQEKLCNVTVVYWGWQLGPHRGYGLLQQPLCGEVLHDVSSDVDARNDVISEDIVLRVSGGPGEVEVDIWLGAEVVLRGKLPKDVLDALDFAVWQLNARTSYSPYFVTYGNPSEAVVTRQVVSGWLYRFYHLPLVETTCLKNHIIPPCPVRQDGLEMTCYLAALSQPWVYRGYPLLDYACRSSNRPK